MLGKHVAGPYSIGYFGKGSLKACRATLPASLAAAVARVLQRQGKSSVGQLIYDKSQDYIRTSTAGVVRRPPDLLAEPADPPAGDLLLGHRKRTSTHGDRPGGHRGDMDSDPRAEGRPLRLAIVNDYALVVAGVAALLAPFRDRVEVVELVSGMAASADVDLVLYDSFGARQGAAMDVPGVSVEGSSARVVVFSWNLDHNLVTEALASGAAGYLSKGLSAEEVVSSLEAIQGGTTIVPDRVGVVSPKADNAWPGKAEGLSVRESEIVALITQGLTNQDIASRSYLSINSVKTYIRTAYRKMGVERRSQAVLWGIKHGFEPDVARFRPGTSEGSAES